MAASEPAHAVANLRLWRSLISGAGRSRLLSWPCSPRFNAAVGGTLSSVPTRRLARSPALIPRSRGLNHRKMSYCLSLFERLSVLVFWDAVRRKRIDVLPKVREILFHFPEKSGAKAAGQNDDQVIGI